MRHNITYRASMIATCLSLALYMTLSPALLTALGVPYIMTTGSFIYKLHPGTYVLFAALAFGLLSRGNPLAAAIVTTREHPALAFNLCGIVVLFGYSILRYGPSGSAFLIETFMAPALMVLTLVNFSASGQRFIYRFMLTFLVVNSLIAIGETILRTQLVPYTISGGVAVHEEFFRATALLGHPLTNAIITSSLLFSVLDLRSLPSKIFLTSLFAVSLLVFGGRAAALTAAGLLAAYVVITSCSGMIKGRFSYLRILGGMLISLALIALFIGLIAVSGFGDRIFSHLYMDQSAAVRLQSWQAFDVMTPGQILFGMPPQDIFQVMSRLGIQYPFETIENPWIYMVVQFGLFGLAVLLLALGSACFWIYRRTGAGGRLALLAFFVIASTYSSLAGKSCSLTLLFAALTCLSGFSAQRARAAAQPAQAAPRARFDGASIEANA